MAFTVFSMEKNAFQEVQEPGNNMQTSSKIHKAIAGSYLTKDLMLRFPFQVGLSKNAPQVVLGDYAASNFGTASEEATCSDSAKRFLSLNALKFFG